MGQELPLANDDAMRAVVVRVDVVENGDAQLDGVRHQPLVVGLEGLEHRLADVGAVLDDGDRAAFERQAGGVLELDAAHRVLGPRVFVVKKNRPALEGPQHDGDQGGLIAANGDGMLDLVFEEIAELAFADLGGGGTWVGTSSELRSWPCRRPMLFK